MFLKCSRAFSSLETAARHCSLFTLSAGNAVILNTLSSIWISDASPVTPKSV